MAAGSDLLLADIHYHQRQSVSDNRGHSNGRNNNVLHNNFFIIFHLKDKPPKKSTGNWICPFTVSATDAWSLCGSLPEGDKNTLRSADQLQ